MVFMCDFAQPGCTAVLRCVHSTAAYSSCKAQSAGSHIPRQAAAAVAWAHTRKHGAAAAVSPSAPGLLLVAPCRKSRIHYDDMLGPDVTDQFVQGDHHGLCMVCFALIKQTCHAISKLQHRQGTCLHQNADMSLPPTWQWRRRPQMAHCTAAGRFGPSQFRCCGAERL